MRNISTVRYFYENNLTVIILSFGKVWKLAIINCFDYVSPVCVCAHTCKKMNSTKTIFITALCIMGIKITLNLVLLADKAL